MQKIVRKKKRNPNTLGAVRNRPLSSESRDPVFSGGNAAALCCWRGGSRPSRGQGRCVSSRGSKLCPGLGVDRGAAPRTQNEGPWRPMSLRGLAEACVGFGPYFQGGREPLKGFVLVCFLFLRLYLLREQTRECMPVRELGWPVGRGRSRLCTEQGAQCGAQSLDPGTMTPAEGRCLTD